MTRLAVWMIGAAALTLAGCVTQETLSSDHGNANAHNLALQIENPVPAAATLSAPDAVGARAALAIKRYNEGEIIVPETLTTSQTGSSGGTPN